MQRRVAAVASGADESDAATRRRPFFRLTEEVSWRAE
jgi:hypothetical protein